jgi:hypothetical protein
MLIKPGTAIIIVVDPHPQRETTDVRRSIIYDILGGKIIIAQTDPPIGKKHKAITVSALTRQRGEPVRYGFKVKIDNFIKEYRISTSQLVPAILVIPQTESQPCNLRACYRISPDSRSGLGLSLSWYPLNLLNISIGGACFSHNYGLHLAQGLEITPTLTIDDQAYPIESTIKRISIPEDYRRGQGLEFISIEFNKMSLEASKALARKIIEAQRKNQAHAFGR